MDSDIVKKTTTENAMKFFNVSPPSLVNNNMKCHFNSDEKKSTQKMTGVQKPFKKKGYKKEKKKKKKNGKSTVEAPL